MPASSEDRKLSLAALVALVIGSMVGSGIFTLPSKFGQATGVFGAIIAWVIAGTGMLMLAFVFRTLSQRKPKLDAGIYAYAKAGFGNYLGFASAYGYWVGCCLADVACLILIKSTLGAFFPIFGDGTTIPALIGSSVILWLTHMLILRGVKEAAALNTIATVAKIVPLVIFIGFVIFGFKANIFTANFWEEKGPTLRHLRPGSEHHAAHRVCLCRHRGRERLFALRQESQRCRRRHRPRISRRALAAASW